MRAWWVAFALLGCTAADIASPDGGLDRADVADSGAVPDTGTTPDGGAPRDAAASELDVGTLGDAAPPPGDAGAAIDSGSPADAATPSDAGAPPDAGSLDAGCGVAVVGVTTHDLGGCALAEGGRLWCWGASNEHGQLGTGDLEPRLLPARVGTTSWAKVVGGSLHVCAIDAARQLHCWGSNESGQLGIAPGDRADRLAPTRVGIDAAWVEVALGDYHTCGRQSDQTLWCWGANHDGRLGLGDHGDPRDTPQAVAGSSWAQVALGIHTCARRTDDTLWCWGYNRVGELGLGDTVDRHEPTQIDGAWSEVAAGQLHTCALRREDGSLWCWGDNTWGQLGLGDGDPRSTPTRVGTEVGWSGLALGESSSCARRGASLYCWGSNANANLGLGDFEQRNVPVRVDPDASWTDVAADWFHTCGLQTDGSLWCWGNFERVGLGPRAEHQIFPARLTCLAAPG